MKLEFFLATVLFVSALLVKDKVVQAQMQCSGANPLSDEDDIITVGYCARRLQGACCTQDTHNRVPIWCRIRDGMPQGALRNIPCRFCYPDCDYMNLVDRDEGFGEYLKRLLS